MTNKIKKAILINTCILVVVLGINAKTSLLINKSESVPGKVFLLIKGKNFVKGDLVGIRNFDTAYTTSRHLTKKIAGTPGDRIIVKNDMVYINQVPQAQIKHKTKDGFPLTPIKLKVIPQHKYFVVTAHKDSFDSRYQEFGLVGEENIEGKVYLIW